jgi:hypothetical protein
MRHGGIFSRRNVLGSTDGLGDDLPTQGMPCLSGQCGTGLVCTDMFGAKTCMPPPPVEATVNDPCNPLDPAWNVVRCSNGAGQISGVTLSKAGCYEVAEGWYLDKGICTYDPQVAAMRRSLDQWCTDKFGDGYSVADNGDCVYDGGTWGGPLFTALDKLFDFIWPSKKPDPKFWGANPRELPSLGNSCARGRR